MFPGFRDHGILHSHAGDPSRELVVSGFDRYIRNPIYAGARLIFPGHFLWFGYWSLLFNAILSFVGVYVFVVLYKEPALRLKFGEAYDYLKHVPRWIPKLPG
jgi:protein-S-isoprenylcysteine O-methyltransferase Ste14